MAGLLVATSKGLSIPRKAALGLPGLVVWMPMHRGRTRVGGYWGRARMKKPKGCEIRLEELAANESEQFGESCWSVVWARFKKGTRDGYVAAFKKFVQYSRIRGWLGPWEALYGKLLQITREGSYEGPVNKVLSGIRLAEKGGLVAHVVHEADWVFAKLLENLRKQKGGTWTRWSPSGIVYEIMARRTIFSWPEVECLALAILSLCNLVRLGEAWAAHRSGLRQ